jgi:modification methylase
MDSPSPQFERDVIHNKDCSSMAELPDGVIDLIISGPPYWAFIDYGAFNRGEDYLWRGDVPYEHFLEKLEVWHRESYRVLRPGRYCIVNLATMAKGRKSYPIPFHAVGILEKIGFKFCFEIVWHKVSGGRARARNFIHRPFPGSFSPDIRTEYLLVFRKNPSVPFKRWLDPERDQEWLVKVDDYFVRETANNVWHIPPMYKGAAPLHPCPFPLEIPTRLIQLFSLPEETVLDPFMGIGTTAIAAKELGRYYVGYELEQEFIQKAQQALTKPIRKRPQILCEYTRYREKRHRGS